MDTWPFQKVSTHWARPAFAVWPARQKMVHRNKIMLIFHPHTTVSLCQHCDIALAHLEEGFHMQIKVKVFSCQHVSHANPGQCVLQPYKLNRIDSWMRVLCRKPLASSAAFPLTLLELLQRHTSITEESDPCATSSTGVSAG